VSSDFEALILAHCAKIHAYLWRLLQDAADADDALQETFLRAFRSRGRLNGHTNPAAWLYRIATNTARTHYRRRARTAERTADLDSSLPGSSAGPAEQAARQQLLAEVAAAVEDLPYQQRAALILRKYQELSYAEVAEALGGSEAAARANVYQALKKLRARLAHLQTA
jgi:RNA polymerase sigma factor (sigma-70 family)